MVYRHRHDPSLQCDVDVERSDGGRSVRGAVARGVGVGRDSRGASALASGEFDRDLISNDDDDLDDPQHEQYDDRNRESELDRGLATIVECP